MALTALAYILVLVWFSPLPLQDLPNHLARALVLSDLLFQHGAQFGNQFNFQLLFTSYLGGDLLLASLVQLAGLKGAAAIWAVLTFISLPLATYFYLRATRASVEVTLLMLFISVYLSTDTFFLMGFLEFKLSVALVLVAFALMEELRERWSVSRFVIFAALVVVAYLIHLGAVAFIGAVAGVSALWRLLQRRSSVSREAILFSPIICVLLWHFIGAVAYRQPDDLVVAPSQWGTVAGKWYRLSWDFRHYDHRPDNTVIGLLLFLLAACLVNRRVAERRQWLSERVLEPFSYAFAFFALYLVLPFSELEATYVDVRALALAPFFLFLALLSIPNHTKPSSAAPSPRVDAVTVFSAAALVCAHLGFMSLHFWKDNAWLAQYRATLTRLPARVTVLPIYTDKTTRKPLERLHAASYALIDRHALIPYQFSGDRGSPMKYFRYVQRPYAPSEIWYRDRLDSEVDWQQIARQYPYLLIMKPYAADRIPIHTRVIAESDAVAIVTTR